MHPGVWQLAWGPSDGGSPEAVSSLLLVPAEDSHPIAMYELKSVTVYALARRLFGCASEVVRVRDLHHGAGAVAGDAGG